MITTEIEKNYDAYWVRHLHINSDGPLGKTSLYVCMFPYCSTTGEQYIGTPEANEKLIQYSTGDLMKLVSENAALANAMSATLEGIEALLKAENILPNDPPVDPPV